MHRLPLRTAARGPRESLEAVNSHGGRGRVSQQPIQYCAAQPVQRTVCMCACVWQEACGLLQGR
jgi:uncharacterized protein (DUF2237 family)